MPLEHGLGAPSQQILSPAFRLSLGTGAPWHQCQLRVRVSQSFTECSLGHCARQPSHTLWSEQIHGCFIGYLNPRSHTLYRPAPCERLPRCASGKLPQAGSIRLDLWTCFHVPHNSADSPGVWHRTLRAAALLRLWEASSSRACASWPAAASPWGWAAGAEEAAGVAANASGPSLERASSRTC